MIEIQCTSCHTRYRIDERVLPDDTPTFKCSRCGHVFSAEPAPARVRKMAAPSTDAAQPPRTIRAARPRPAAVRSPIESDVVKRGDTRAGASPRPEPRAQVAQPAPAERSETVERAEANVRATAPAPEVQATASGPEPEPRPQEVRHEAEDDPLNRPFGDREQKADTGENLKFDFSSERSEIADELPERPLERPDSDDDEWQVGEPPSEFASAPRRQPPTMMDEPEAAPRLAPSQGRRMGAPLQAEMPRYAQPRAQAKAGGFQLGDAVSAAAEAVARGSTHASGFFLALFFFVFIAFFGASAIISGEPAASVRILSQAPQIGEYFAQPIVPAMLVTLHDVHSEYYGLKSGHVALVISGNAQNVGTHPLHMVEIDANLIGDGGRPLASQTVYCGNELSARMLGEMTPREIEFSQGLSPQRGFALNPSATAPFLMVFVDPPAGAGKIRISVSKAAPLDSTAPAMPPA
jgi:predicted Zn finger-like uncharacterized protein